MPTFRTLARRIWRLHWFEITGFCLFLGAVLAAGTRDAEAGDELPAQCGNIQSSTVVITR